VLTTTSRLAVFSTVVNTYKPCPISSGSYRQSSDIAIHHRLCCRTKGLSQAIQHRRSQPRSPRLYFAGRWSLDVATLRTAGVWGAAALLPSPPSTQGVGADVLGDLYFPYNVAITTSGAGYIDVNSDGATTDGRVVAGVLALFPVDDATRAINA
jgi:hypothetical protein